MSSKYKNKEDHEIGGRRELVRELILYWRLFQFDLKNKIFWFRLISMYHFTIITLYICVCTHVCVFISLYPPHFYNLRLEKSCINENSCSTYYLQNSPSSNYVLELLTLASNWFHEYFLLISLWIRTWASNCKLLVSLAFWVAPMFSKLQSILKLFNTSSLVQIPDNTCKPA